jgi:hypothetical protein
MDDAMAVLAGSSTGHHCIMLFVPKERLGRARARRDAMKIMLLAPSSRL